MIDTSLSFPLVSHTHTHATTNAKGTQQCAPAATIRLPAPKKLVQAPTLYKINVNESNNNAVALGSLKLDGKSNQTPHVLDEQRCRPLFMRTCSRAPIFKRVEKLSSVVSHFYRDILNECIIVMRSGIVRLSDTLLGLVFEREFIEHLIFLVISRSFTTVHVLQ